MRKVILFIAMSLDGYIADANGSVDWLMGQDENGENLDTYSEFVKEIDTVIMGWNTYHQVATELSPEEWVYKDMQSYVVTHRQAASTEEIIFTGQNPCEIIHKLQQEEGKNIWVCGGASVVQQLIKEDVIDEYYISVIPTILGKGIRLFSETPGEMRLELKKTLHYNGIVELVYERECK